MIHLEPAHAWLRVAQRATVVARPDHRDLSAPALQPVEDDAVEERSAHAQVAGHPLVLRFECGASRDIAREPIVRFGVAERGRQPLKAEPVGGDPSRGARGLPVTHRQSAQSACPGCVLGNPRPPAQRAGRSRENPRRHRKDPMPPAPGFAVERPRLPRRTGVAPPRGSRRLAAEHRRGRRDPLDCGHELGEAPFDAAQGVDELLMGVAAKRIEASGTKGRDVIPVRLTGRSRALRIAWRGDRRSAPGRRGWGQR